MEKVDVVVAVVEDDDNLKYARPNAGRRSKQQTMVPSRMTRLEFCERGLRRRCRLTVTILNLEGTFAVI